MVQMKNPRPGSAGRHLCQAQNPNLLPGLMQRPNQQIICLGQSLVEEQGFGKQRPPKQTSPLLQSLLVVQVWASALFASPKQANAIPARPTPNFLNACRRVTDWAICLVSSSNLLFMVLLSFARVSLLF
jgi:hypothetical protein